MNTQLEYGWRYDAQTGAIRDFYVRDGVRRWVDADEPCPGEILKGNADLVPAQHAYLTTKPGASHE